MHFTRLSLTGFKNAQALSFEPHPKINCLLGRNGAGKTTVLDAVYYLAFTKSFFNPIDTQNIHHDGEFFVIEGELRGADGESERLFCAQKRGEKKRFKRNQKDYERLADHIGFLPLVMIAPADADLIREGSEVRRKFMDGIIAQYDRAYLDSLAAYNRLLAQRNALLKHYWVEGRSVDETTMEVYDEQLHALGTELHAARTKFAEAYGTIFSEFYSTVVGPGERAALRYESQLTQQPLAQLLRQSRQNDLRAQFTTKGIHKDDLLFEINGHAVKKTGSQGQQKSFVVALRLAQFDYLKNLKKTLPVLLLDDVFDKLDDHRVAALMKLVSDDYFGQVFITDANEWRVPELFARNGVAIQRFLVENGEISKA